MKFWWVNQNQTYKHEVEGGYLWAPKRKANGAENIFYENMTKVSPGDIVFSFCDTEIKALGVIQSKAETANKPGEFGRIGQAWESQGWIVQVDYHELLNRIRPKDYIDILRPTLPPKYSPLQLNGNGNQAVYLAEVPSKMAGALISVIGDEGKAVIVNIQPAELEEDQADVAETAIRQDAKISDTEKAQLVKARRGQGIFRTRLERVETRCRVTGVRLKYHLRASHIKPWKDSNNSERLDGENGLLLAPHIDHLFDRGYISFADDGQLMIASDLNIKLLSQWHVPMNTNVGEFTERQKMFLEYHRHHVFRGYARSL